MVWQDSLVICESVVLVPGTERHSLHPSSSHIGLVADHEPACEIAVPGESVVVI